MSQCTSCGGFCKKSGCERADYVPPKQEPVDWEQEREAFEVWYDRSFVNKGHAMHNRFHDRDGYCIDEIQNQWKGWKERAKRTTPPQRTWVGLTRADRFEIEKAMSKYYDYQHECKTVCLPEFAAAIEAKLKEKNT